jgi:hypothetical protein
LIVDGGLRFRLGHAGELRRRIAAIMELRLDAIGMRVDRLAECGVDAPAHAALLQPVHEHDADHQHDPTDEQPEEQRIDGGQLHQGAVSASSSASAMSTATTRETPGSGMVIPIS